MGNPERESKCDNLDMFLILLSGVATFFIISWLLKYCSRGIDFTDEGFYLVWINNPFIYDFSRTQFGFFYHPLYKILSGDIAQLRRFNVIITFLLAYIMVSEYFKLIKTDLSGSLFVKVVINAGFAISSLVIFGEGLITPNYNTLAFQAAMISIIGLFSADRGTSKKSIVGWCLMGVGVWIAFMGKPSTALALAVGLFLCLIYTKKYSIKLSAVAVFILCVLLIATAFVIDGGVIDFIKRFQLGMEFGQILVDKLNNILRIDGFEFWEVMPHIILSVIVLLIAVSSGMAKNNLHKYVGVFILGLLLAVILNVLLGQSDFTFDMVRRFQGLLIFIIVFASSIAGVVLQRSFGGYKLNILKLAPFFLVMPHIYAFGTSSNYWMVGGGASIFWLMAGLGLIMAGMQRIEFRVLLPMVIGTQVLTVLILQGGIDQPYRQPQSLRYNNSIQLIGPNNVELILSDTYAEYINHAIASAHNSGYKSGMPMIDLTGQSPGLLFALGAKSIGHPWTLGGYPGSELFLEAGLSRFSCEDIANAWLIIEPNGPRSISERVLFKVGVKYPEGYEFAGVWSTAQGVGGFDYQRMQELYKPIAPKKALRDCQMLR